MNAYRYRKWYTECESMLREMMRMSMLRVMNISHSYN
ncbi:MAG: hypothetical protein RI985_1906, partial [Chloroflexota bacterium]